MSFKKGKLFMQSVIDIYDYIYVSNSLKGNETAIRCFINDLVTSRIEYLNPFFVFIQIE